MLFDEPTSALDPEMVNEVLDEVFGLGPLEPLMRDSTITDILINGPKTVYIERNGRLETTDVAFHDDRHLIQIVQRIVGKVGRRVDETNPIVDARLPDGSRINAIIPPLALDGPLVSIRRLGTTPLQMADLVNRQALAPDMVKFLEDIAAVPTTDTSPERTAKFIKDEIAKWAPVIRAAGVQIE